MGSLQLSSRLNGHSDRGNIWARIGEPTRWEHNFCKNYRIWWGFRTWFTSCASFSTNDTKWINRINRCNMHGWHCVKSLRIRSYSGLHFPACEWNTKRYGVSLCIQSECGKMRTRMTPNKDTFHAVLPITGIRKAFNRSDFKFHSKMHMVYYLRRCTTLLMGFMKMILML